MVFMTDPGIILLFHHFWLCILLKAAYHRKEIKHPIPNNFKLTPDLDKNSLKGKRFGLLNSGMEDEEGKRLLDKAINIIKSI